MRRGRPPHPDILTPREWEVLSLLREGLTNREIGERLGVTRDGVKYHVAQILTKLSVRTREEAAAWEPAAETTVEPRPALMSRLAGVSRLGLVGSAGAVLCGLAVLGGVFAYGELRGSDSDSDALGGGPPTPSVSAAEPPTPSPVEAVLGSEGRDSSLGQIAYVKDGGLHVLDLETGEDRLIVDQHVVRTFGAGGTELELEFSAFSPEWSADGRWIAYGMHNATLNLDECRIARLSDGFVQNVTSATGDWEWAPNSLALFSDHKLYTPFESIPGGYYAAAGGRYVTNAGFGDAKWSPDGRRLAIGGADIRYVGNEGEFTAGPPYRVYIIDPAAAQPTISPGEEASGVITVYDSDEGSALPVMHSWSPDGKYVLFWKSADGALALTSVEEPGGIQELGSAPLGVASADWSPDGSALAFLDRSRNGVVVRRFDGAADTFLGGASDPTFSPDARRLAYSYEGNIFISKPDGLQFQQLTADDEYANVHPQWSGDGSHLLYVRMERPSVADLAPAASELWLMNGDGSDQRKVSDLPAVALTEDQGVDWGHYFSWYRPSGIPPFPAPTYPVTPEPTLSGFPTSTFRIDDNN